MGAGPGRARSFLEPSIGYFAEYGKNCRSNDYDEGVARDFVSRPLLDPWIFLAMALELEPGTCIPGVEDFSQPLSRRERPNIPIANRFFILMMYPRWRKVKCEELGLDVFCQLESARAVNQDIELSSGPILMFFSCHPLSCTDYSGVHGGPDHDRCLARCIAMVIVWKELAKETTE